MGLDIDLVKFDKEFYDKNKDKNGKVEYSLGSDHCKDLASWRKRYDIRNMLADRCDLLRDQCTFGELTRLDLKKVLRQAVRKKQYWDFAIDQNEMKVFIPVLRKVLHQTNFNTETVALSWVS